MKIKEECPRDNSIISPQQLLREVNSFSEQPLRPSQTRSVQKFTTQCENTMGYQQSCKSINFRNKKRDQGLKRLIREQKVKMIVNRFIDKLKLNITHSKPVIFEPYNKQQRQSIYNANGIEISDTYEKILSILIIVFIIISLFIYTTAALFPQIIQSQYVAVAQKLAFIVFFIQFISSCVVVKMIGSKKIQKINQIIRNYMSDGLFIDFIYLIILTCSFFIDVGDSRLFILLKLPECFQRIQRIQNAYVNTFYKEQYWGLTKVVLMNFALAHFLSLTLILISYFQPQHNWMTKFGISEVEWYQKYIWAYYWGTTAMLTVGFGDITPANYIQAMSVVFIQTFSCLALAYNINCVGSLISNIKSQDIQKNKSIKTFKMLSNRNNISEYLELKINNYIQESTNIRKRFNFEQESKFISTLPNELKADFLKQSNKKIFQNLVFFKNLTQKTLLAFAQVIHLKICHPEQIIKKRGQLSGLMILKQGKVGFCTKGGGNSLGNISIDNIKIEQTDNPYLLNLDFISRQTTSYQMKSEQYSILYYLSMEETLLTLKTGELDYQHFCFLRDRGRILHTQFEIFSCQFCKNCHTKFDCPKLHYCPLIMHVIDKYLYGVKRATNGRFKYFERQKKKYLPFRELQKNLKILQFDDSSNLRYIRWKFNKKQLIPSQLNLKINDQNQQKRICGHNESSINNQLIRFKNSKIIAEKSNILIQQNQKSQKHSVRYNNFVEALKDQISNVMVRNNQVWLIQCDQIKNYKFYFPQFNPSTLRCLTKKSIFLDNSFFV